jgi:hypothetical protein
MPRITLFTLFMLFFIVAEGLGAGTAALQKPRIVIDNGLLSVALESVPAREVFRAIAQKERLIIRLDEGLLKVPLTDQFERLPLEEGLRRLIRQLQTDNFLLGYVEDLAGGPRVVSAEILAKGSSGVVEQFGGQAAASARGPATVDKGDKTIPRGRKMQIERGLNPGQQKHVERMGKMPGSVTRIPEGVTLRMERGEDLGGWQWKVDRALKAQMADGSQGPAEDAKGQSVEGSEGPEKK